MRFEKDPLFQAHKISIDDMALPEIDIIQAKPIVINLDQDPAGKKLLFEIPSIEKYFRFESRYVSILAKYFILFSKIQFMEFKDFGNEGIKEKMIRELKKVMQNRAFKREYLKMIREYFKGNFNLGRIFRIINPMQASYLFLFIHCVIETVKKKFISDLGRINHRILEIFSISSSTSSGKIVPRY